MSKANLTKIVFTGAVVVAVMAGVFRVAALRKTVTGSAT